MIPQFSQVNGFLASKGFYTENDHFGDYICSDWRSFESLGLNQSHEEFEQICCQIATEIEVGKNSLKTSLKTGETEGKQLLDQLFYPLQTGDFLSENLLENNSSSGEIACMRLGFLIDLQGNFRLIEINSQTPSIWWECELGRTSFFREYIQKEPRLDYLPNLQQMLVFELNKLATLRGKSLSQCRIGLVTCDNEEDVFEMNFLQQTLQGLNLGQNAEVLIIDRLDFDSQNRPFSLNSEQNLDIIFFWYPFEWLLEDRFANGELVWPTFLASLRENQFVWFNGLDSFLIQNKSFLHYFYENLKATNPSSPLLQHLIPTFFSQEELYLQTGEIDYIAKPVWGREGEGISGTTKEGNFAAQKQDYYDKQPCIYQPFIYSKTISIQDKPRYFTLEKWVYKGPNGWLPGGMTARIAEHKIVNNKSLILFLD